MVEKKQLSSIGESIELINHSDKPLPTNITTHSSDIVSWTCLYRNGERIFCPNFRVGGKLYCAKDESKWFAALVMPESFNSVVRMMETKENLLYEEYCSVCKCLKAHVGRTLEEYYDDVHLKNDGLMTAEDFECQHGDVTEWIGSDEKVLKRVFDDCLWYRVGAMVWGPGGNTNICRYLKSAETKEREDKAVDEILKSVKETIPPITTGNFGSSLRDNTERAKSFAIHITRDFDSSFREACEQANKGANSLAKRQKK